MFTTSFWGILLSLLSMIVASVLLHFDTAITIAYILLVAGFFGIGISILIGFFKMISETNNTD